MKKIVKGLIIGLVTIFPFSTRALSGSVGFSCEKTRLAPNESTKCTISYNVGSGVMAGFGARVESSNLILGGFTCNSNGWQGGMQNGKYILYGGAFSSNTVIGTVNVTAGGEFTGGSVTLMGANETSILVSDNESEFSYSPITVSISAKSTNSLLSGLSVDSGSLSPAFDASKTTYSVTTDKSSINISATAADGLSNVSGAGVKTLNYGNNTFKIIVTAESGATTTYTINVNRPDNRSTVNTLKTLTLSNGSINFSSDKTSYNVKVDSKVSSVKITSSLTDSKSRYTQGSASFTKNLSYGLNTVYITVQAENGSSKTYTLKITREDDRSSDTSIKSIDVSSGSITVESGKDEYELKVPFDTEDFDIRAVLNDNKSKVEINGNKKLEVGENVFEIIVTAENGSKKSYFLKVFRQEKDVKLSNDSSLKLLEIAGYEIDFKSDTLVYKVSTNDTKLDIKAISNNSKAKVKINNNADLKAGSEVSIVVTAEDGTTTEYKILIEKKSNILVLIIICCSIIAIGVGGFFVLRKNKDSKKSKK